MTNDFRIGNIVNTGALYLPYGEGIVCEILADCLTINVGGKINQYPYDGIKGIPLSEEKLLEFGFEKCELDSDYWFEYRDEPLRLVSNDTIFNNNTDKWVVGFDYHENDTEFLDNKIQYVHQLQNLYFALTGEELSIKLN